MGKFLRNGVLNGFSSQASGSSLKNMDEVITLASIVEREAKTNTEKNIIAGIFLNRLKMGMNLESDATRDIASIISALMQANIKSLISPIWNMHMCITLITRACPACRQAPFVILAVLRSERPESN